MDVIKWEVSIPYTEAGKRRVSRVYTYATSREQAISIAHAANDLIPPSVKAATTARPAPVTASDIRDRTKSPHWFSKDTMKLWGDTMGNFRVSPQTVNVRRLDGEIVECWELVRRNRTPVGRPAGRAAYFNIYDYSVVHGEEVTQ